jgi:hypothetical protein
MGTCLRSLAVDLALKNIEKKWTRPIREWKRALQQFAIVLEGGMPLPQTINRPFTQKS